eukprot:scaffold141076_cov42-Prasinocladus_malaysianus.AAC.2
MAVLLSGTMARLASAAAAASLALSWLACLTILTRWLIPPAAAIASRVSLESAKPTRTRAADS